MTRQRVFEHHHDCEVDCCDETLFSLDSGALLVVCATNDKVEGAGLAATVKPKAFALVDFRDAQARRARV